MGHRHKNLKRNICFYSYFYLAPIATRLFRIMIAGGFLFNKNNDNRDGFTPKSYLDLSINERVQ